jgi:hypothetical protein
VLHGCHWLLPQGVGPIQRGTFGRAACLSAHGDSRDGKTGVCKHVLAKGVAQVAREQLQQGGGTSFSLHKLQYIIVAVPTVFV